MLHAMSTHSRLGTLGPLGINDAINDVTPPATTTAREHDRASGAEGFDHRNAGHGMLNAGSVAPRWKVAIRHILVRAIGKLPGCRFKSRLLQRLLGVRMGKDVGIAYGVFLDPYDPSMISFGDNVIVGFETKIFVHMFTLTRQRVRPVTIGSNVMIGACCIIAPGVTIGDGATITPGSLVTRDIPAGAMVSGNPMTVRERKALTDTG